MTRTAIGLLTTLVSVGFGLAAQAQTEPTAAPEPATTPPTEPAPGEPAPAAATGEQTAAPRKSWEDIVVVPRKAFLKGGRLELAPFTGITLNDVLIRHYTFGGDLSLGSVAFLVATTCLDKS